MTTSDTLLKRVERRAIAITIVAIVIGWIWSGWRVAAGIGGGALIGATSYWAIKRSANGVAQLMAAQGPRPSPAGVLLTVMLRYALLAGMAYVMIARLRLHPIGLLGGATVIPLAAASALMRGRA